MMRANQITLALLLSIIALPATAQNSTVTAITDLKRLSASTIIPAIRTKRSVEQNQLLCLALAIYHEARGETEAERLAVAQVIYNRAAHTDSTVCATVWADKGSQFQWVKSAAAIVPREQSAWKAVQRSAVRFADHRPEDNTHGATYFYNPALSSPDWARQGHVTVNFRQVFLRIGGRDRFNGKVSTTDPISQLDEFGRLPPSRKYVGSGSVSPSAVER